MKKNLEPHYHQWLDQFESLRQQLPRHSAAQLCRWLRLPYATLRRWRNRHRNGQIILQKPGPRKLPGLPIAELQERITGLKHGSQRSRGTGSLYRDYRHHVSRRELGELVSRERKRKHCQRRIHLQQFTWNQANVAWAIDATLLRRTPREPAPVAILARDLASHYHFDPLLLPAESAVANVGWLESLLRRHRAPLLLKRDNGSPFNDQRLECLLSERCILPLNSPVHYPRYNGAIEHGIGSFKRELFALLDPGQEVPDIDRLRPLVRAVTHLHNSRPRRSLGGLSPAQAYLQQTSPPYGRRQRHQIFESISASAAGILESKPENIGQHDLAAAWRQAVLDWLRCQHLITVSKNQNCHPVLPSENAH